MKTLRKRRTDLLRKVDDQARPDQKRIKTALDSTSSLLDRVTSTTDYIRNLRSKASKLEDLQLLTSSTQAMKTILEEKTENVQYGRGVEFVPTNINELLGCIEVAGSVTTVPSKSATEPKQIGVGNSVIDFPTMTLSSEKVHGQLQVVDEERELTDRESSGNTNRPDSFVKLLGTCSSPFSIPPSSPSPSPSPSTSLSASPSPFPSTSLSASPSPSASTSLSPSPSLPSPISYWETNCRQTYDGEGWTLLQMGVVEGRENLDVGTCVSLLPRSVCVSVENSFSPRPSLYIAVWRTDQDSRPHQVGERVSLSPPTLGTELTFTFGLLLDVGRGRVTFIDVGRGKLLAKFDLEFTKNVYPMFFITPITPTCSMRLVSGSEIEVTDRKRNLIQQALSN